MVNSRSRPIYAPILFALLLVACDRADVPESRDSCRACHTEIENVAAIHPADVGYSCGSCHQGEPTHNEKDGAHEGLIPRPGQMADVDRTCRTCHPDQTRRVLASPMTAGRGMVRVTREVFGESVADRAHDLSTLEVHESAADAYFAQLCSSCHLGLPKERTGAWQGYEKGGLCLACHLNHETEGETGHPNTAGLAKDQSCFNCHSRSGRISLNYQGLRELTEPPPGARQEKLPDGRTVFRGTPDVHHAAGMACIDCHTGQGVMGDGREHARAGDAVKIACSDCHRPGSAEPNAAMALGREIQARLQGGTPHAARRSGETLSHVFETTPGFSFLRTKVDGRLLPVPAFADNYTHGPDHERLNCESCHATWAPACAGCHISYDPGGRSRNHLTGETLPGRWVEHFSGFFADPPTLGVDGNGRISPFVPGMKLTIDAKGFHGEKARSLHRNLFAALSPHTTGKSRSCRSCHLSPLALGYGRGRLERRLERWFFHNEYELQATGEFRGIAVDGWIPFLREPTHRPFSTDPKARPLNLHEQEKVLAVGRCLLCHEGQEKFFADFSRARRHRHSGDGP